MTHYDQNVYDPSKLTGDDALVMKGFELCRDAVLRLFSDIAECGSPVECCVALFFRFHRYGTTGKTGEAARGMRAVTN